MATRAVTILFCSMLSLALDSHATDLRYKVIPMPKLWGGPSVDQIADINNTGTVVGTTSQWTGHYLARQSFHWTGRSATPFFYPEAYHTEATGINDHGVIVANADVDQGILTVVAQVPALNWTTLPTTGSPVWPADINNHMQIVGSTNSRAFLWSEGVGYDLGTLGGEYSRALAISDSGIITGMASTADTATHAFLYSNGTMYDLGALAGGTSMGLEVNNAGTVVGNMWVEPGSTRSVGFVYQGGTMTFIDTMGGDESTAVDINEQGWIVGSIRRPGTTPTTYDYHGYLYIDGEMIDLNALVDPAAGWRIGSAHAINDRGQIVADACHVNGFCGIAVLSAVPEPATWALLLVGLPLVAGRRRRH